MSNSNDNSVAGFFAAAITLFVIVLPWFLLVYFIGKAVYEFWETREIVMEGNKTEIKRVSDETLGGIFLTAIWCGCVAWYIGLFAPGG